MALFFILTFGLKRYVFTKVGLEGKIPAIDQFGGDKNKNLLNELVVVPHPVGSKALIRLKTPGAGQIVYQKEMNSAPNWQSTYRTSHIIRM